MKVGTALARPRACATMTQGHWEERGRAKAVPTFIRKDGEPFRGVYQHLHGYSIERSEEDGMRCKCMQGCKDDEA